MTKNDSFIDEGYAFRVQISWWEVLFGLAVIIFIIYLIKRKSKK